MARTVLTNTDRTLLAPYSPKRGREKDRRKRLESTMRVHRIGARWRDIRLGEAREALYDAFLPPRLAPTPKLHTRPRKRA